MQLKVKQIDPLNKRVAIKKFNQIKETPEIAIFDSIYSEEQFR